MRQIDNLEKIAEFLYGSNTSKGVQIKPIFKDEEGGLWVGKKYSRIYAANEKIAYDLSVILNLPDINLPEIATGTVDGKKWLLSRYIDSETSLRESSSFKNLTEKQSQIGILFRLMANIDGNMRNVIRDKTGKVWFLDYEYSGFFQGYESRFLDHSIRTCQMLRFFMGELCRTDFFFEDGVKRLEDLISKDEFTLQKIQQISNDAGLTSEESASYGIHIFDSAKNIRERMLTIIKIWNDVFSDRSLDKVIQPELIPFYQAEGKRCAHACINIVSDYFCKTVPVQNELVSKIGDGMVFLVQMAKYFQDQGFNLAYFINKDDADAFLTNDFSLMQSRVGTKHAKYILSQMDIKKIKESLLEMIKGSNVINRKPTLKELSEEVQKDHIIICTIDMSKINGTHYYQGHHVVLTCIGEVNAYFHDVGPKNARPNKKVHKELFARSLFDNHLFDYNVLIIKKGL